MNFKVAQAGNVLVALAHADYSAAAKFKADAFEHTQIIDPLFIGMGRADLRIETAAAV